MIDWMYAPPRNDSFEKSCHYAYFCFKALSECHPLISKTLFSSDKCLKKIYRLVNDTQTENVTARGYF